jgi:hypothetical protein
MKKILTIVLAALVMVLVVGCASYNPRTGIPDVKTFQETGIKFSDAEIMIVAYPIQTKEDADVYFDNKNLAADGLLPIYVNISNIGNKNYHPNTIFIQANNRSIPTISADTAYKLLKKSYGGKAAAWGIWTYGLGAPISAAHTASINNKIEKDLKEKEMKNDSGFLYFKIPDDIDSLDSFFLMIFLVDRDGGKLTAKLPLKGQITAK